MVYLLHFNKPISSGHTTQHYIGWCPDKRFQTRMKAHRRGKGARLTQVACERQIDFVVAQQWFGGDRQLERQLKNRKNGKKMCWICNHRW